MPTRRSLGSTLILATLAAACGGGMISPEGGGQTPSGGTEPQAMTSLPRSLTPAERGIVSASNAFTFALWHQVAASQRDSNVFASPLSASYALAMTMNGAGGSTLDEMRSALQLQNLSVSQANAGYKSVTALLTSLDPSTTMQIANSIWYRSGFAVKQSFIDTTKSYFNATVSPLDFDDQSAALAAINGWVDTQTHGRIPTIVDEIHRDQVMFLINAIYFKGNWRLKFDSLLTTSEPFHGVGGDRTVRLMHKSNAMFAYTETPSYQAVDLPYGDSAFTMTVVLPTPGTDVETVAASLTADSWQSLTSSLHPTDVTLTLPKFSLSWSRDLIPDLQALGMRLAFTDAADFTGIAASPPVEISSVRQKAFVQVDETGTEAAAVTSVGITVTSAPLAKIVRVDRPFIFAIRERLTGTVLFVGKVVQLPN
jgi:serpin B